MQSKQASMEIINQWRSKYASHTERVYVPRVNFWRDFFPKGFDQGWENLDDGQFQSCEFNAGELVVPWSEKKIYQAFESQISTEWENGEKIIFATGRYFPKWLMPKLGFSPEDRGLFRVISHEDRKLKFDLNDPLSRFPLKLTGKIVKSYRDRDERGGQSHDIMQIATGSGFGMQACFDDIDTDFYSDQPFQRESETSDADFYAPTRMTHHVDSVASNHISEIYSRFLEPGMEVLDLMSSWMSHIENPEMDTKYMGLGLNEAELKANKILADYQIHDLNQTPILPFDSQKFDLAICSLSVEYLTQPHEVFKDLTRVLKPGGRLVITFSDRWFPPKVIRIWQSLFPFERLGLIIDYFKSTGSFENIETESIQGYKRPFNDQYYREKPNSDPIFAVWGQLRK